VLTVRQAERLTPVGGQDPDGWQHLRLRMEWPNEVPARLLALGDRAEVFDPPEVQQEMLTLARQVAQRYAAATD
jgi:hypothetical protein